MAGIKEPGNILIFSTQKKTQQSVYKFSKYTGCELYLSKFVPGSLTNPRLKTFREPRLIIIENTKKGFQVKNYTLKKKKKKKKKYYFSLDIKRNFKHWNPSNRIMWCRRCN